MIKVNNLSKKYGKLEAVSDLNFTVEAGKTYGFLGPNGAGKSTTMNMLTGYLSPTTGTIEIAGIDIIKEPEKAKRHIGYLPENPPLYPDMTVFEYLMFVAELKQIKKSEAEDHVDEIMDKLNIADVEKRLIKKLSKGYKQRIGLAQAMIGYPDVIILDEPTVGLDPLQIIEIREMIRELKEKHTIIISSHILSEITNMCDYVMILSNGRLVALDTMENLVRNEEGQEEKSLEQIFLELTGSSSQNEIPEVSANESNL